MDHALTVRDLLLTGRPLYPAEVLAGEGRLSNPVSWVVSLRPYAPALPQLKGDELALVATEYLARFDPPLTVLSVIRQLVSRNAAALAVRGEVDHPALEAARQADLPLLRLAPDAPLPDIEQAIIRECALHQARREMLPAAEPDRLIDDLLSGDIMSNTESQSMARKHGFSLTSPFTVAFIATVQEDIQRVDMAGRIEAVLRKGEHGASELIMRAYDEGVAVLLPQGAERSLPDAIRELSLPCGIGKERPLIEAALSLAEARMAATASIYLYNGALTSYDRLGADRLLVMLYRDHPGELKAFVEETLGPLLRHDTHSAVALLPTVRSFVEHGGRLRETAAEIYVHRNTLAYRLDRAAQILGTDLKQPRTRLAIEMALRALPLLQVSEN